MKKINSIINYIGFGNLIGVLLNLCLIGYLLSTRSGDNPVWVIVYFIFLSVGSTIFWVIMFWAIDLDHDCLEIEELWSSIIFAIILAEFIILLLSSLLYILLFLIFNPNANNVDVTYPLVGSFIISAYFMVAIQFLCGRLLPSEFNLFSRLAERKESKGKIREISKSFGLDPSYVQVLFDLNETITEDIHSKITKEKKLNESELVMLMNLIEFKGKASKDASNYDEVIEELTETYRSIYSSFSSRIEKVKTDDELINEEILSDLKTIKAKAKGEGI